MKLLSRSGDTQNLPVKLTPLRTADFSRIFPFNPFGQENAP